MASQSQTHAGELNSFSELFDAFRPLHVARLLVENLRREGSASTTSGVLSDTFVIKHCITQESLQKVPETRVSQPYLLSFILRHAAAWVALFCERLNQDKPELAFKEGARSPFLFLEKETIEFLQACWQSCAGVHLSLTARGIEWKSKELQTCGHFDAYASAEDPGCLSPALGYGGYCFRHSQNLWFQDPFATPDHSSSRTDADWNAAVSSPPIGVRNPVTTRHNTMMEFYANFANLYAYTEAELDEMVQRFFRRWKQHVTLEQNCATWALQEFNYSNLAEARSAGCTELKKRYRRKALEIHPDLGGDTNAFQAMQRAYGFLQTLLLAEPNSGQ